MERSACWGQRGKQPLLPAPPVAYREAARRIAAALAECYAGHPAIVLRHVQNEHSTVCWCDHAATAFRRRLRTRHGSPGALNEDWGTAL